MARRRWGALVVTAVVATLLAACTPAPAAPAASARVEIVQRRTDIAAGVIAMAVTNTGDASIVVDRAEYDSPRFAESGIVDDHAVTIPSGRTIDLRFPAPGPDCGGTPGPGTVTLTLEGGSSLTIEPTDPTTTVEKIVTADCVVESVDEVVAITAPAALRVTGEGVDGVAHLDLGLAPTGADGEVRFTGARSTNLIASAETHTAWVLDEIVSGTDAPSTLTLNVRPTRCDAHAVAEDKVGTIVVLDVVAPDGTAGRYALPMPDAVKTAIYEYLGSVCLY